MTMRRDFWVVAICVLAMGAPGAKDVRAQTAVIEDQDFLDADWDVSVLQFEDEEEGNGGSASCTRVQRTTDGQPPTPAHQEGDHSHTKRRMLCGLMLNDTSTFYDPSVDGPIGAMQWTHVFRFFDEDPPAGPGVLTAVLLLKQGGNSYISARGNAVSIADGWVAFSDAFVESDFGLVDNTLDAETIDFSSNPDFSASGGIIEFGYATSGTTSFDIDVQGPRGKTWKMDNYRVRVFAPGIVPALSAPGFAVLVATLMGAGWFAVSRRRGLGEGR